MGRAPCCDKVGLKRGPWTVEEDRILISFIREHGHSNWRALPKQSGLLRCGKSCRLRWINYLKPDIKRGNFTKEEEDSIIQLHEKMGNRWSAIAAKLPGRTDNEIKNVWHTHLKKRLEKYQTTTKPLGKKAARSTTKRNGPENVTISNNSTNSFRETTSDGTIDNVSSSPGQSNTTTSDDNSSSVTDISSVEFPNNNEVMGEQMLDIQHSNYDDFISIIDETFWSIQDFSEDSTMPEISNNFLSADQNSQENYYDENMDFWMDVFVRAGEKSEMPEF